MPQNGYYPNHLDPSAQEFYPTNPAHFQPPPPPFIVVPHPQLIPKPIPLPQLAVPIQQQAVSIPPAASAPTRAILLSTVPVSVSESTIRHDLEVFGHVRAVQMDRIQDGIVTVHFYDLRASHAALDTIRQQHMCHQQRLRIFYSNNYYYYNNVGVGVGPPLPPPGPGLVSGRVVWANFVIPVTNAFPDGLNQGTIVIFNLDPNVSGLTLKNIFQVFGPVKELRETPNKRQQRFVEFFDIRDASRALAEMAGKEINGRTVMIEYSRPGGHFNKFQNHPRNNGYNNRGLNFNNRVQSGSGSGSVSRSPPPPPTPPPAPQGRTFPYRNRKSSPRQHLVTRRRRSPQSSEESESVEAAMCRLSLERDNGKKGNSGPGLKQKASRPWKGRQKNYDPRYLIKEEAIIIDSDSNDGVKDTRTTVMIKNIPNKYSQKLLLNMLDNHCIHCNELISGDDDQPLSSYDFVYLPIDFNNKCNVGYGFVNMTSPEATLRLYKAFHHQHWEVFNSRKICEVTYARVQGLESLKEHFKNSKFACENDEYLPVVFTPPRDGRRLPSPLPIVFSNTLTLDRADLTSTTSTITLPSSEDFDHYHHEHHQDDASATFSDGP